MEKLRKIVVGFLATFMCFAGLLTIWAGNEFRAEYAKPWKENLNAAMGLDNTWERKPTPYWDKRFPGYPDSKWWRTELGERAMCPYWPRQLYGILVMGTGLFFATILPYKIWKEL